MAELTKAERLKKLDVAVLNIEKKMGQGSIMSLGDKANSKFPSIPSGDLGLDYTLGGGWARGRISEIFSQNESTGKTTICLHAIAEAQKLGLLCAFVDAEHALDPTYAKKLGVNTEELLISQPDCGEDALEIVDMLLDSEAVGLIVVDSVAGLVPKSELEGEMGDAQMGKHARLMSQAMRKLTGKASKTGTHIMFTNQMRSKIGISFGDPNVTTGGNALKFFASQRVKLKRTEIIGKDDNVVGINGNIKCIKNKVAPPFRTSDYTIMFGEGVKPENTLTELAIKHELLEKSGSWFTMTNGERIQGKSNVGFWLKENPDEYTKLDKQIRQLLFSDLEEKLNPPEEKKKRNVKPKLEEIKVEDLVKDGIKPEIVSQT